MRSRASGGTRAPSAPRPSARASPSTSPPRAVAWRWSRRATPASTVSRRSSSSSSTARQRPDWRAVEIDVVPGVSALQAAAARVGAPLGHDFCAISLSDLLTPVGADRAPARGGGARRFRRRALQSALARRHAAAREAARRSCLRHRAAGDAGGARPQSRPRRRDAIAIEHARRLRGRRGRHADAGPRRQQRDPRARRAIRRGSIRRAAIARSTHDRHFIGAGPGAPDLITVRGLRLIERCPVCLYAGSLVPAAVVAAAPAGRAGHRHRAPDARRDHRRDARRRMQPGSTSRACIRATSRSMARSPSRCGASTRSASPTT